MCGNSHWKKKTGMKHYIGSTLGMCSNIVKFGIIKKK